MYIEGGENKRRAMCRSNNERMGGYEEEKG